MNVAPCLPHCPRGGKRDSYIPLRICPYLHSPRSREDRGFDTTKNQKTGQEKVEISSPHGFDKALEWTLCFAFTHCPPRGDRRQHALHVAQNKNQNPGQAMNGSVASSWAYAIKDKPLRVASQSLTAPTSPLPETLPPGRKMLVLVGELTALSGYPFNTCSNASFRDSTCS